MESFTATITPENNDIMGQLRKRNSAARDAISSPYFTKTVTKLS